MLLDEEHLKAIRERDAEIDHDFAGQGDVDRRYLLSHINELSSKLGAALDEIRQLYRDDGCTEQEIEDQIARFQ